MAEASKPPPKRRMRVQKSCTECQRRKQKCIIRRPDVPCVNCSRRFPPVECVITQVDSVPKPAYEDQIHTFELPAFSVGTGKQPEVTSANYQLPTPPTSSNPGTPGALAFRIQRQPRSESPSSCGPSWNDLRKSSDDLDDEHKSLITRKARANLFLDGNGDPMAFFHNSPASFGGILSEVTTINGMPLPEGPRTMELLHFYVQVVAPNMVSIDGQSQPPVFLAEVLPWMLQSPLFPNIGVLMSSMTQSLEQGMEITKNSESLALKARVLTIIAEYMERPFDIIAVEMVRCIINLVVMEWFWGADDSMFAHMRGIKRMINLRNGMRGLGDVVGESIIVLTDYEIACCFETDLYWQENDPIRDQEMPIPTTWPDCYDSPLLGSTTRFESIAEKLGICITASKILDDVRFLTTSITTVPSLPTGTPKIRSTASWLYEKLRNMPTVKPTATSPESDWLLETIRLAALIYSWAVNSLRQISNFDSQEVLEDAYVAMRKVSLTTWKKIPGIFLWIMLVAAPNAAPDARGRFVRRKMAVTGLSIGFEDFVLGTSYLKSFWTVQQWIAKEGDAGVQRLEDKWLMGLGREREPNRKAKS
ncbi:Zn(2)-C6 fungal-type DNA-binding domain protein [Colletotrichum truncatum]|uniref:Zn(2)-C6 fungal-type DNA-binding domain protein n=1 Tax=Colletotrichum truncatum TaxID=5467 RepID=A0ACC3YTB6_COLTU|nr:Zn(2)-C6 fungal-type DNA-binding domain protein [Colletotrichum truncatum]KAF6789919.1 Zn(2)-C6 fungal-type DNA-binding domain protein [Colletotrichum truncatum]